MNNPTKSSKPAIHIRSARLDVEIAQPGTLYTGSRFDWTGYISQITLDGQHTFCAPESLEPGKGTGGLGLCNEFGIETAIGYQDARTGEAFPKLGIGLLARSDDSPYNFFKPYELIEPFPLTVETSQDRAVFTLDPLNCRGYAARLRKTISAAQNELSIHYELENTGTRALITEEYCHNFMAIDRHSIGPDYQLRLGFKPELEPPGPDMRKSAPGWIQILAPKFILDRAAQSMMRKMADSIELKEDRLEFRAIPKSAFYSRLAGFSRSGRDQFKLVYMPEQISISEMDDFEPMRFAVWGMAHVASAEVFKRIDLDPGQSTAWTRRYTFNAGE